MIQYNLFSKGRHLAAFFVYLFNFLWQLYAHPSGNLACH